ncbi:MAG: ChbG/HpnK family deacetylase [Deltaproteobacteria bacterium]|nr:ChbG/HpnK family deacetylase [Deltaproteobacteria bacterium]
MKRLIINADDLGADVARNAGIFEAIEAGAVTAASILVNGPAFPDVLHRIASSRCHHISFGVHLNLTEGTPLSPGLTSITGPDGCFCGKAKAHRLLMRKGDKGLEEEIREEFAAQIQALRDAGVRIDHVDGHQHVHIFPAVIDATVRAGREFGILWIRLPEEPPPSSAMERNNDVLAGEADMFCRLAAAARIKIHGSALRKTDYFRGLYLKGRMSSARLEETLQTLPPGLTELMVHPGRAPAGQAEGPFSSFSHREREKELEILTDRDFSLMIAKFHIRLTPFPEASP